MIKIKPKLLPIKIKQLTPEQITQELKKRAKLLKKKINKLEKLKFVSQETMQITINI